MQKEKKKANFTVIVRIRSSESFFNLGCFEPEKGWRWDEDWWSLSINFSIGRSYYVKYDNNKWGTKKPTYIRVLDLTLTLR